MLGFAGTMHNGIVTESFGYPELRGVSLVRIFTIKPVCRAWRPGDMQVVAAGYAAQYTPAPKPLCAFTSASWVQAQVSC